MTTRLSLINKEYLPFTTHLFFLKEKNKFNKTGLLVTG